MFSCWTEHAFLFSLVNILLWHYKSVTDFILTLLHKYKRIKCASIWSIILNKSSTLPFIRNYIIYVVWVRGTFCGILWSKWYERIINFNGDFCYVIPNTVRFWLHEKRAGQRIFHLLKNQIENDLQIIFTFVRGDGVKAEYHTNEWKWTGNIRKYELCKIIYVYSLICQS